MRTKKQHILWRIDGFCGRLNPGLLAVAFALAGIVLAGAACRAIGDITPRGIVAMAPCGCTFSFAPIE